MTFNKYSQRAFSVIHRDSNEIEGQRNNDPSWVSDFMSHLQKDAVKSKKEDDLLFNQINSILGNKSKYSSVEEAVLDMQKRTGLYDLLHKEANSNILNEIPALKSFIDNYVEERPGTSVDAVVHDLLKIKTIQEMLPQADDVPIEVKHYINDKIKEALDLNPTNHGTDDMHIGKTDLLVDDGNVKDDPLGICMPSKGAMKLRVGKVASNR